jgi:hypothetical protein
MTQQFVPVDSDRTAPEETILSPTGFSFWWKGTHHTVQPNVPATLRRAQIDALEASGPDGAYAPPPFKRVKLVVQEQAHPQVWQTPSSGWVAPEAGEVEPTPLPKKLPAQVTIIADEYIAYSWHGQTLTVRPRERMVLECDQVRHLANLGFPFKVVD